MRRFVFFGGCEDGGSFDGIGQWAKDEFFLVLESAVDQGVFVAGVGDLNFSSDQAFLVLVCLDEVNVFAFVEGLARNADGVGDLSDGDADLAEDAREKDLGVDEAVILPGTAAEVNTNP